MARIKDLDTIAKHAFGVSATLRVLEVMSLLILETRNRQMLV